MREAGKSTANTKPGARKGRGRPRKILDAGRIIELASKGNSVTEIAAICGVSDDTLHRNFAAELERGSQLCNASLRRQQFQQAMAGSDRMLIHLGKHRLGQKDAVEHEHTGPGAGPIVHTIHFGDGETDEKS